MSERGSFRGGRGGGGGGRGGRQQQKTGGAAQQEKPKKENILDLGKYMDKEVQVKFNGGREGKRDNYHDTSPAIPMDPKKRTDMKEQSAIGPLQIWQRGISTVPH